MGKTDLTTTTAEKIYEAWDDNEIFAAVVFGDRGIGKSSFCLKVIYDLYHNGLGYDRNDAWRKALENTIHSKEMFTDRFSMLRDEDRRARILHHDDAEQWMSGRVYQRKNNDEERALMQEIEDMLPSMRTRSAGNLYSCDNPQKLAPAIKDRPLKRIKIIKTSNKKYQKPRQARVYGQEVYPSLKRQIDADELWKQDFDTMLPDKLYKKYKVIRKSYSDRAIDSMENRRKKLQEDELEDVYKISPDQAAAIYLKNEDLAYRDVDKITGVRYSTISDRVQGIKKEEKTEEIRNIF